MIIARTSIEVPGRWLRGFTLVLAASLPGCSPAQEAEMPRNAILYVIDTLRTDHLSMYGYGRETSPELDAFASQGVRFDYCLSQSPWTKPSTASLLTGLYPAQHGATQPFRVMPEHITSLAETLGELGVRTGGFFANSWASRKHGLHQGFGVYEKIDHKSAETSRQVVDRALSFLEGVGQDPFFCYLHVIDPHAPYSPGEPYTSRFTEGYTGSVNGSFGLEDASQDLNALEPEDLQHLIDLYDASIAKTDAEFGRLLSELKRRGLYENTLIVVVADHGEEFKDHGGWRHNGMLFNEVVRVPLIMRFPGAVTELSGTSFGGLVQQIDVAPTILAHFGAAPGKQLSGRNLAALLQGTSTESAEPFGICEVDNGGVYRKAVVAGGLKYVRAWAPANAEFLYDLRADPAERVNLLDQDPGRADAHRAILDGFLLENNSGTSLLFQNGGSEMIRAEILIFTDSAFPAVFPFYTEEQKGMGELRDGRPESEVVEWEGRQRKGVRIQFNVEPGDGDGIRIETVAGEKQLELHARIMGSSVEARYVRLGAAGTASDATPFVLQLADSEALDAPGFPARADLAGDPYRVRIWTTGSSLEAPAADLSDDDINDLKAIGYLGDD